MLDELPELARRIKVFVREHPRREAPHLEYGTDEEVMDHRRAACPFLTGELLVRAAQASRRPMEFMVTNEGLPLASIRSFENRVNTTPLAIFPGAGIGLVRVLGFEVHPDYPNSHGQRFYARLEFSPLGWPELPDMAEADLNVLFDESKRVEPESSARRNFL